MAQTRELAIILAKRDKEKYAAIIQRAALNGYHDFKFDSIPGHPEYGDTICPKMTLMEHLSAFPELDDISTDVMSGKYDESPDEVDNLTLYTMLMNEGADDFIFKMCGLQVPTEQERYAYIKQSINN